MHIFEFEIFITRLKHEIFAPCFHMVLFCYELLSARLNSRHTGRDTFGIFSLSTTLSVARERRCGDRVTVWKVSGMILYFGKTFKFGRENRCDSQVFLVLPDVSPVVAMRKYYFFRNRPWRFEYAGRNCGQKIFAQNYPRRRRILCYVLYSALRAKRLFCYLNAVWIT